MKLHYILVRKKEITFLSLLFFISLYSFSQVTYTFTNCGATGSLGPIQAQVNAAYALTNLNGNVGVTATGIQTWTVPTSGLYRITAFGASSGQNSNANMLPGLGARIEGEFNLIAGDVLQILVGQMGENHPSFAAGGGGGSFVTKIPHNTLASILVIAGGGGAPSGDFSGLSAVTASCGTFDVQSGPAQCNGVGGISFTGNSGGGGGGFFTDGAGNATVANGGKAYVNGGAGASTSNVYVRGGFGGGGGNASPATSTYASSGGGGFSGGNGGNRNSTQGTGRMGGGGGGSYNNGSNQLNTILTSTGHGLVTITRLCNITLGTNTGSNLICQGAAVTLTTDAISSYTWSTGSNAASILVSPSVTSTYSLTAMSPSNCITSAAITISVSNGVPILSITASSNSVCLNNTVSISASGALTYTFSGGISNGVPFTPSATSTYTIVGQNGCGTSTSLTTISIAPLPVIGIITPTIVCAGNTATLSGGGANTYTWMPGSIVGTSVIISPQQNTTYTVTGESGSCLGTNTVALTVNPNPTITASTSNFTLCEGESATLTAIGALNYTWQPGGFTGASVVVTPTIPTAFTVIGENSLGCTGSAQQPVIVYPTPTINTSSPNPTICPGASIVLNASGANTYSWSNGANTNTISVSPASTTTYTVVGTFTNSQCSSSKTIEVNVFVSSLAITAPTAVCVGSSATLQASGAGSYSWSNGAIGNISVVSPTVSSTYTVTGISTVGAGTCSSSASVQVLANPLPTITIAATQTFVQRFCPVTFTAFGAISYNWVSIGTGSIVTVTPSAQTVYSVQGTDINGCVGTATILVRIYSGPCGVAINENILDHSLFQIFPNPSTGAFKIKSAEPFDLLLVNEIGQIIMEIQLQSQNNYTMEINNLQAGIYFVTPKTNHGKLGKKIVVQ
ncbi:MAG: glycine-rich protein [Bacteroidia bacterium]|jgi:hypothetical protein|nr:glycine-rich protein [Bacteroidia bacterium]